MKRLNLTPKPKRRQNKLPQKFMKYVSFTAIIFLGVFIFSLIKGPGQSIRFIFQSGLRQSDNRVNVLLLGNAGGIHEGAELTDTIIVASFNLKTKQVYLISLPRDLWIDDIKGKVNAIYEIGESKGKGGGLSLGEQTIGNVLGLPVHYGVRVDFSGFTKAVDLLGGVNITVEKSFEDSLYPIEGRENDLCGLEEREMDFSSEEAKKLNIEPGKRKVLVLKDNKIATDSAEPDKGFQYFPCRYETISFEAGETHMSGTTALKFVRSRMGTNSEGSDFARSRRQQLVLESFRKKAFSLETFSSPSKVSGLLSTFGQSFETDIPSGDMPHFYNLTKKTEGSRNLVLATAKDLETQNLFMHPPTGDFGGAWVLVPNGGNFDKLRQFIKKVLQGEVAVEASSSARTGN